MHAYDDWELDSTGISSLERPLRRVGPSPGAVRPVAVFDPDLPPGVAFIRSLGRAGVPVIAYTSGVAPAGRFSKHVSDIRPHPGLRPTDDFVDWLAQQFATGSIDLVAPTSDQVSFCVAEALERLDRPSCEVGIADAVPMRTSLLKHRFAAAMESAGFPTPAWAVPTSLAEAQASAHEIGYPVVLKPRTHVGIGTIRGSVVRSPDELVAQFAPYPLDHGNSVVLRHDPDVAWPLLQRYHDLGTVDVVSVTGFLGHGGHAVALGYSRKVNQAPRRLGVGTMFEPIAEPGFAEAAARAVRSVVGRGLFELEVLVDRTSGEHWAVDLNPRAFGQITLDIALGNDLPRAWYGSATGVVLPAETPMDPPPELWQDGLSTFAELVVGLARGPHRAAALRRARERARQVRVAAVYDRRDPLPGLRYGLQRLRHPRAFVRPLLADVETCGPSDPAATPPTADR